MGAYFKDSKYAYAYNNEFRGNAYQYKNLDGIDLAHGSEYCLVVGNLSIDNGGEGIDTYSSLGSMTIKNNTVSHNGKYLTEQFGIRVYGENDLIEKNIINYNYGAGIGVTSGAVVKITKNSIYQNGNVYNNYQNKRSNSIGIDLLTTTQNHNRGVFPYYSLNDSADLDIGGNDVYNFPILERAYLWANQLYISGYSRPGAVIEFFVGDTFATSLFPQGKKYFATYTEGSIYDLDNSVGSYGPWAINSLMQGEDYTNKFKFIMNVPSGVSQNTVITSTATIGNVTSEFSAGVGLDNCSGKITPNLECIIDKGNNLYTALYGYNNPSGNNQNIAIGSNNNLLVFDLNLNIIENFTKIPVNTIKSIEDLDLDGEKEILLYTKEGGLLILDSKMRIKTYFKEHPVGKNKIHAQIFNTGFGNPKKIIISYPDKFYF